MCLAVLGSDFSRIPPGSTKAECEDCICEVWLAPSAVSIQKQHSDIKLLCMDCTVHGGYLKEAEIPPPNAEQRRELEKMGVILC
jgi:hypothetical protein